MRKSINLKSMLKKNTQAHKMISQPVKEASVFNPRVKGVKIKNTLDHILTCRSQNYKNIWGQEVYFA